MMGITQTVYPMALPQVTRMLAWFDPKQVTLVGGLTVAAPNLAPLAPGLFTQTHAERQPVWSATAVNGTPGIVGSQVNVGGREGNQSIQGPIRPLVAGAVGPSSWTCIQALDTTGTVAAAGNISASMSLSCSTTNDVSRSFIWAGNQNGNFADFYRWTSNNTEFDDGASNDALTYPAVYTYFNNNGTLQRRKNGVAMSAPGSPNYTGTVGAFDAIGIGGLTNLLQYGDANGHNPHANQDFMGSTGMTVFFAGVLSGSDLSFWEHLVAASAGISI